jgi:hypothetical protein
MLERDGQFVLIPLVPPCAFNPMFVDSTQCHAIYVRFFAPPGFASTSVRSYATFLNLIILRPHGSTG